MATQAMAHEMLSAREIAVRERQKSLLLRAWILAGIFFMTLPGTVLGFSNLLAISAHHGFSTLSHAWIEGHGHAQVFGWIGSFVLGIGFYSQPARGRSFLRIPLISFALWISGVGMRWAANIYGWHWRLLVPASAIFEFAAMLLFLKAARHHRLPAQQTGSRQSHPPRRRMELWMVSVLLSTIGLAAMVTFNLVECLRLAWIGIDPSFPHSLDQKYLVLLGWGFLVPVVWGFSARWLPTLLAIEKPRNRLFAAALMLDVAGVLAGVAGSTVTAAFLLLFGAIAIVFALRMLERPHGKAKTQGIHPSFPVFARLPYLWLVIAGALTVWAALADHHNGIWGASRHALTVGFAATMVFVIGPRILPHFGGVYRIFSTRLILFSLLILQIGCTLRVASEPLAYEGILRFAWKTLPVSGVFELAGVLLFAANIVLTYTLGKPAVAECACTECHSASAV